jgi:hypothetical protein
MIVLLELFNTKNIIQLLRELATVCYTKTLQST